MEREPLTHFVYVSLTASDREILEQIADERGATLSSVVRRLIRVAATNERAAAPQPGTIREAANATAR